MGMILQLLYSLFSIYPDIRPNRTLTPNVKGKTMGNTIQRGNRQKTDSWYLSYASLVLSN